MSKNRLFLFEVRSEFTGQVPKFSVVDGGARFGEGARSQAKVLWVGDSKAWNHLSSISIERKI